MKSVSEGSNGGLFNQQMASMLAMAQAGIDLARQDKENEDQLNALKTSNALKLALLKRNQEKELVEQIINAEKQLIEKRTAAYREAADREADARLGALLAAEENLTEERENQLKKQVEAERDAKYKQIDELIAYEIAAREKQTKKELEAFKKKLKEEAREEERANAKKAFSIGKKGEKGTSIAERKQAAEDMKEERKAAYWADSEGNKKESDNKIIQALLTSSAQLLTGIHQSYGALSDLAKQYENQMDKIGSKKSAIDTRLQGSSNKTVLGSYWDKMSQDITGFAGVSPLIKQSAVADRVTTMVGQGIAFNVEQRATLDVLKDKIATTFDAANGTLLRLVKIQQQDTTAGRLGMESALTAFLNNMYETTEYMQTLAKSVKGSLEEAMSLMTGENALSFEYQIQKWLGSLSSVGMSDSAVQGLAGVLGQVAAGKIEGITSGGQGNLVIMAANQAGVNVSDILNNGLDQNTTNVLMDSMVDYLAKLYSDAGNSKVIQQQIANVYGLSASDLKAAVNLSRSRAAVANDGLDYNSAIGRLQSMAGSMWTRTGTGELLSNMWDNINYSMAAGMASNPITYAMFKVSNLLEQTVGDGLNFSLPIAYGTGSTMTFDIPDLMRAGSMSAGVLNSLGRMLTSGGAGGITGNSILRGIGIKDAGISTVSRGTGAGLSTAGGITVSESGSMVGNSSSDDITSKTMTDKTDQTKSETAQAADESDETKLSDVDSHVCTIIEILRSISDGNSILKVAIDGDVRLSSDSINGIKSGI